MSGVRASVVIPAYNAEAFLRRAVMSALRQTVADLEVLICDDASRDATRAVAQELAASDSRVKLLRKAANGGPAAARNLGIDAARGEWIVLLDADDEIVPRRIERLIAAAEERGADMAADNLLICPAEPGRPAVPMISPRRLPAARWMPAKEFVEGNIGSRWNPRVSYGFLQPVIRRAFLRRHGLRYGERNRFGEDFLFALDCLLHGARWWLTPEPMYRYVVRSGTLTEVQSAADLLRIRQFEERTADGLADADPALARALRRHARHIDHFYCYRAFTDALKANSIRHALRFVRQRPGGLRHIVVESLAQAPRVTVKALRGGYGEPPRTAR